MDHTATEPITPVIASPSPRRPTRRDRTLVAVPGAVRTLPTQSSEHGQARRSLRHSPDWLPAMDVTASLSGHAGCVNALSWSEDGQRLVSGSDDFRLCVWRMGSFGAEAGDGPNLGMALETVVRTGHSRNIFGAKFAPFTGDRRLLSCAGDGQVRVFDLDRSMPETMRPSRGQKRPWDEYGIGTACVRVFRCHRDRVKRIAVEGSPDVFLTCSEDGTVRQHDLRVAHACTPDRSTCPPPLISYASVGLKLHTLTVSRARPEVIVVGPYAHLHDRRMIRTQTRRDWGLLLDETNATQCVRRFGLPPDGTRTTDLHITACKLSESNGRDLLVTYSQEDVHLFDLLGDAQPTAQPVTAAPDLDEAGAGADSVHRSVAHRLRAIRERKNAIDAGAPIVWPVQRYSGHRNVDTVKDVNLAFGDQIVLSGSDDGRLFAWTKATGELVGIWDGDASVVNVIQPHPFLPVVALSGIDDTVKIFAPTSSDTKRTSSLHRADEIARRNREAEENGESYDGSSMDAVSARMLMALFELRIREGEDGAPQTSDELVNDAGECRTQ